MTKRKIIIIDDEPMLLALIAEILFEEPDLEISTRVTTKEEFVYQIGQQFFDLALIDLSLGKGNDGLELLHIANDRLQPLPVIVLSAHEEKDYALKCLMSGAKGYINKNYICPDLARGCREVLNGGLFVSGIENNILEEYRRLTA
jgi:DNA-binding NarL/FixJ family response regulator